MPNEDCTPNSPGNSIPNFESCQLDLERKAFYEEERRKFEDDFLEYQKSSSSSGRLMYTFLRRSLWQFHLSGIYSEACILNEAYVRGCEAIAEGETVRNTGAWLRQTAYNVIREWSRYHQRFTLLEEHLVESAQMPGLPETLEDDLVTLRLAFQMLNSKDQKLLNLKIGEGFSWKEVQDILKLHGDGDYTESALRKRKERALIRLRKKFHALKPAL